MRNNQIPQINPAQLLTQYQNPGESLRGIGKSLGAQADSMENQKSKEIELARQDRAEQRIIDDRTLAEKNRQGLIKFGEIVAAGPQQTDWMNPVFTKEAEAMSLEGFDKGSDEYNRRLALQEKTGKELAEVIDANKSDPRLRESRFEMYNRALRSAGVVTPEMLAMVQQAGEAEELARESKLAALKTQQTELSKDTDKTQLDAAKTMFIESGKTGRKGSGSGSGKSETEGSGSLKQDTYDKALEVAMGQYKADYVPKWMSTDATNLDTLNQYAAANKINPDKMFALLRSKTSAGSDKNDISEKDVNAVITELTKNPSEYTFKSTKQGIGATGGIDRNTALAGGTYQNIVNQQIANDRVQQATITDEIRKANMSSEERRTEYARTLLAPVIAGNKVTDAVQATTETNGNRPQTDTSTKKGTKEEIVKAVGGGLTEKGVLNAEATKSINDRLAEQGITKTIPTGISPEKANKIVNSLMKRRDSNTSLAKDTDFVNPYQTVRDQAVENYNNLNARTDISPINKAIQQLGARAMYGAGVVGDLSSRAMIGLDNVGTSIGNLFRVEQKPMMTIEEGQKAFRDSFLDTDTMKESRAKVAAQVADNARNAAIQKIINNPETSSEEQYNALLELGLSKGAAKKASRYR